MTVQRSATMGLSFRIRTFLEMIKFSHTVFALPFAFTGAVLAARGFPSLYQTCWIVLAMVGARTAAMGLNRLIDAEIDGCNPRTSERAIPAGLLGKGTVLACVIFAAGLMFVAAYRLNPLCLRLAPVAFVFLILYSYCKRFTSLAHVVLGLCLGAAPLGAWIAIRGTIEAPPVVLATAVVFWSAGFDVLYALQDLDFDRGAGLHSIPVKLGVRGSLVVSRLFHLVMMALLVILLFMMQLKLFFAAGLFIAALLLIHEHRLLKEDDLSKLDMAFFNVNGYISLTVFFFTLADVLVFKGGVS